MFSGKDVHVFDDIEILQARKEEGNDRIRDLYDHKEKARDKFLNMHE